jgi:hypothetical protein
MNEGLWCRRVPQDEKAVDGSAVALQRVVDSRLAHRHAELIGQTEQLLQEHMRVARAGTSQNRRLFLLALRSNISELQDHRRELQKHHESLERQHEEIEQRRNRRVRPAAARLKG